MGGSIGTVTTWPLAGFLIETIGWQFAFYIPAIMVAIFSLLWFLIVFNTPALHPRILLKEKEYIEENLPGISEKKVTRLSTT